MSPLIETIQILLASTCSAMSVPLGSISVEDQPQEHHPRNYTNSHERNLCAIYRASRAHYFVLTLTWADALALCMRMLCRLLEVIHDLTVVAILITVVSD